MDISKIVNTPSPPPEATGETSAHKQSADASGSSAANKGNQRATSGNREEYAAAMAVLDKGAKHRLSQSPPESKSAPKQPRLEASDDHRTPPAAPAQAKSLSLKPVGSASNVRGWQAFTADQLTSPTTPQTLQESPSASRPLPSFPQSSAHAEQAMVQQTAEQSEATFPECYRNMDHWKESVKQMVQDKRESGRPRYYPNEKVAIVELFEAAGMTKINFCSEILMTAGQDILDRSLADVAKMKKDKTLPDPWRPAVVTTASGLA